MTAALLTPRARRELLAAVGWISHDNRAAARALRDAVARAAERLARYPESGVVRLGFLPEPYRFASLRGFPYVLVYDAKKNPPLIVTLLHTSRDLKRALADLGEG